MGRTLTVGVLLILLTGCASQPVLDGPSPFFASEPVVLNNPVFVPLADKHYGFVFETMIRVLKESGFRIAESNRFDGRIETLPRVAPGIFQPFKAGSSNFSDRLLASAQSIRHRASVKIQPAGNNEGYFIHIIIRRELEDLPRPVRSTAGAAIFASDNNVERQFEEVDPTLYEADWIPKGRDLNFEQYVIRRVKALMP